MTGCLRWCCCSGSCVTGCIRSFWETAVAEAAAALPACCCSRREARCGMSPLHWALQPDPSFAFIVRSKVASLEKVGQAHQQSQKKSFPSVDTTA